MGWLGRRQGRLGQGAAGVGCFRQRIGRGALRWVERAAVAAAAAAAAAEALGFAAGATVKDLL